MLAKKTWRIVAIRQIRLSFLPAKVLFYTVVVYIAVINEFKAEVKNEDKPPLVSFRLFNGTKKRKKKILNDEKKHHGAVDELSSEQQFHQSCNKIYSRWWVGYTLSW